jgi:hypothetical protein
MSEILSWALLACAQDVEVPAVDEKAGTVSFAAKACKQDVYPELKGALEYILVNRGGKSYECLFEAHVDARAVLEGLQRAGAKPGKPAEIQEDKTIIPEGSRVRVWVEWKQEGKDRRDPIEAFVLDEKTKQPMEAKGWLFTGSKKAFNPATEKQDLQVLLTKNLATLYWIDGSALLTNPEFSKNGGRYRTNKVLFPKEGTPVRIVLEAAKSE